ncbi:hypothetical protein DSL72_006732 [Monilinia vaccinii-corymbosi]|uniref:Uncharacterized protein n=1 Tax=Monilinia vaccinii-corymbosi TaxID=61207 RepID=A0A8A3PPL3_9HELO|nr:hypothetical protein DSL72_006732 [Monilinia vaccinii-corymbosi]
MYDSWAALVDDDTWSWDGLYAFFVKSSIFAPSSDVSYPSLIFPDYRNKTLAANAIRIETSSGPESGDAIGFCWVPQTLDPATYDPVASRPNPKLVTGHPAESILFDDALRQLESK